MLSIIIAIAFLALLMLPKFTGTIFYKGGEMEDPELIILVVYILYGVTSFLYIVAFAVYSCCNQ